MNFKSIATGCVLASFAFAALAAKPTPVKELENSTSDIGVVNYLTDYQPGVEGTVLVSLPSKDAAGSYVVFTDIYTFTLDATNDVTASAQVVGNQRANQYWLSGGVGELSLYEGSYHGGSLAGYALEGQTFFGSTGIAAGDSLVDRLVAGDYFYVIQGTTSGKKGGEYNFDVSAVSVVPEPGYAVLLLAGLGLLGALAKRRKIS